MSNILNSLGDLIGFIIIPLLNLLPNSPFKDIFSFVDKYNILGYVNWIIPFDRFCLILDIWLPCIAAYYLFNYTKGVFSGKNSILNRILDGLFG